MAGQTFNDSGIDKSVGALVLGMVVVAFLLLLIVGMDGAQRNAESASNMEILHQESTTRLPVNDLAE